MSHPMEVFYNTTIGSGNDTVYGLVHCMASPSAGNCSFCVNSSIQALMTACPNQKEAISWGGDPVPCIVRYANRYFFGSLELSPTSALYNTAKINATLTRFDQAWSGIRDIVTRASTNSSRLAAETTDQSSTQKIYVFMQCTPDVSQRISLGLGFALCAKAFDVRHQGVVVVVCPELTKDMNCMYQVRSCNG
ncbi:hypothetical protein SADUNF_Sadunf11G0016100 [Salix dunnii]|uniref:Gnk2-homologous domain-containing protein n=1 Tax=Salix dunnii TaxID=1413687 RepID=A0A835MSU3_9ROSI|nr:hypothetical protein SADUNF_Sadunf11G0016100 [Salix dunnii]